MTHKGYTGRVVGVDPETGVLHGRVLHILGVITFEAETGADIVREFRASVDDYLTWCRERGKEPVRPYSGRFQTRIPPALHKRAVRQAKRIGVSLNDFVQSAITAALLTPETPAPAKPKPMPAAAREKQAKA